MSLSTFLGKLNADIAKVAPLVDDLLPAVAALVPSTSAVVGVVEAAVTSASKYGLTLENDVEDVWSTIEAAVTQFAASKTTPAPTQSPTAGGAA